MAIQLNDQFDIHSKNWYAVEEEAQKQADLEEEKEQIMALQQRYSSAEQEEEDNYVHHPTINTSELYDNIALQTGDAHDIHSKYWYDQQEKTEQYWNMQAENGEPQSWNPTTHVSTIDQGELYNGMAV